jgi:fatty-acyl-CoA synthase
MINQKFLVRWGVGFINLRYHFRLMTRIFTRKNRTFFLFEGKEFTYRETYKRAMSYAQFFLSERKKLVLNGRSGKKERMSIGIYQENRPEFIFALLGAAISNTVVFAINTGFRGDILARIINQANLSLLLIDSSTEKEINRILPDLNFPDRDSILFAGDNSGQSGQFRDLEHSVSKAQIDECKGYRVPIINTSPFIVIYTSGTTGLPKGVPCTHIKLFGAGLVTQHRIRLRKNDRGYICMPLFHSNSLYLGIMPILRAGGSFVLKRRFSASSFEEDMLKYRVTYMNYVGQPLHYIIAALEKKYGSGDAVEQALARHPQNRFRIAHGNGSSAVDRIKLMRYLGMEHIYELYGSTEATITTANRPGDPIESVGRISDSVIILNSNDTICPPGKTDKKGLLVNYEEAVGEISKRIGPENVFFDGYLDNDKATDQKFRNGFYHSGDLGHVRIVKGKRYLYFNGRTDDWIRKDGENFSAENVLEYAQKLPGVELAIAYGVPCEISDEKVMIALTMMKGASFDCQEAFNWFMTRQQEGGMDPKWMPDYIRIVEEFTLTNTQKIVVKSYKREHFNIITNPEMVIFNRQRGETTYHRLTAQRFNDIVIGFKETGRLPLLGIPN